MNIVHIVGARPQFIKLAPLSALMRQHHDEIIVHSGQHYDHQMNDVFFADLQIPEPDYNLGVGSGTHAQQTAGIMIALDGLLSSIMPDWVIVYGDTNTTLAGALTAVKLGIPVAHVESGLRSYNRQMPEEINRVMTDHISDLLLAPTPNAMMNLSQEGLADKSVLVGDIMVDSLAMARRIIANDKDAVAHFHDERFMLLTLHRASNVDDPELLNSTLAKINAMGRKVIFPVHPRTAKSIIDKVRFLYSNISFVEPQSYLNHIRMMEAADMIITDSGGMQKEAYMMQKQCVTLRDETEWTETVATGWNILLPPHTPDYAEIISSLKEPSEHPDLFGRCVSAKILDALQK